MLYVSHDDLKTFFGFWLSRAYHMFMGFLHKHWYRMCPVQREAKFTQRRQVHEQRGEAKQTYRCIIGIIEPVYQRPDDEGINARACQLLGRIGIL